MGRRVGGLLGFLRVGTLAKNLSVSEVGDLGKVVLWALTLTAGSVAVVPQCGTPCPERAPSSGHTVVFPWVEEGGIIEEMLRSPAFCGDEKFVTFGGVCCAGARGSVLLLVLDSAAEATKGAEPLLSAPCRLFEAIVEERAEALSASVGGMGAAVEDFKIVVAEEAHESAVGLSSCIALDAVSASCNAGMLECCCHSCTA